MTRTIDDGNGVVLLSRGQELIAIDAERNTELGRVEYRIDNRRTVQAFVSGFAFAVAIVGLVSLVVAILTGCADCRPSSTRCSDDAVDVCDGDGYGYGYGPTLSKVS